MANQTRQIWEASEGDVEKDAALDCTDYLKAGETVASVGTIVEVSATTPYDPPGTGDLTLENAAVLVAEREILQRPVAIGKGLVFQYSGQQAGVSYRIRIPFTTSSGRVKIIDQRMVCLP